MKYKIDKNLQRASFSSRGKLNKVEQEVGPLQSNNLVESINEVHRKGLISFPRYVGSQTFKFKLNPSHVKYSRPSRVFGYLLWTLHAPRLLSVWTLYMDLALHNFHNHIKEEAVIRIDWSDKNVTYRIDVQWYYLHWKKILRTNKTKYTQFFKVFLLVLPIIHRVWEEGPIFPCKWKSKKATQNHFPWWSIFKNSVFS